MVLGLFFLSASVNAEEQAVLKSQSEKLSYATGVAFVRSLQQTAGAVNLDLVIQGMQDALTGEHLMMNEADIRNTLAVQDDDRRHEQLEASRNSSPVVDNAGAKQAPAGQAADRPRQEQNQSEQNGQLAQASSSLAMAKAGGAGPSVVSSGPGSSGSTVAEGSQLASNGPVLSRRNQAKLSVAEMKREVRGASISNKIGQ